MTFRQFTEQSFTTHDGQSLYYRHWAATEPRRGAIVLFHRGHEHSARMAHLVDELNLPAFDFFAWDARGHGKSPGPRGYSPSFGTSVRDVQTFTQHLNAQHGLTEKELYVVAQSVGAVLIATWVHDYAPLIRGMTLASPAFKIKLYVPFARAGLALLYKLRGLFYVNSYVKAKFLTHDPVRIASYETDPLVSRPIAVNVLLDLYRYAKRIVADAQAINVPTQMLVSGSDWVVHRKPQEDFFERLSSPHKSLDVLEGFYHDTLGEKDRAGAVASIRANVLELFDQAPKVADLKQAHLRGYTAEESERLSKELAPLSPRGIYWDITRFGLKIGGNLSTGIALGHSTGFDSGSTLDYVYRNQATGTNAIGKMIDRTYLDSIGWRGIRVRKQHIEALMQEAASLIKQQNQALHIVDIAAGHGRYVLEGVQRLAQVDSITLRDYSELNVRDGSALIQQLGLEKKARFIKADAFDADSIAATQPAPTLGLVSGLYELFADNAMVAQSLSGLAKAIQPGGYLIYTNQPWHPQLELIARALTSHRAGQAWVMRRRTQAEMDQLVRDAGFTKLTQRIDEFGIFTVCLAVKKN
jgi:alpha-beta hydrolase superfamily lysophospholipase/16S rRNA G966 N2-methylase RsmD